MHQPKPKRMKYYVPPNGGPRPPTEDLALPKQLCDPMKFNIPLKEIDADYLEIERTMQVGDLANDICNERHVQRRASFPLERGNIQLLDMALKCNLNTNSQKAESSPELATARAGNTALNRGEALLYAWVLQQINIGGNF